MSNFRSKREPFPASYAFRVVSIRILVKKAIASQLSRRVIPDLEVSFATKCFVCFPAFR